MRFKTALPIAALLLARCSPAEDHHDVAEGASAGQAGEAVTSLGGEAGSPNGSGGTDGGIAGAGLGGDAKAGGTAGQSEAGAAGLNGEAGAGGAPVIMGPCTNPRIVELFDFSNASKVKDAPADLTDLWMKGCYGSTNTKTHALDGDGNPNTNPANLANMSHIDVDPDAGIEKPALRYTIPFSSTPTSQGEVVNLAYTFALPQNPFNSVDMGTAVMTASAFVVRTNPNCELTATLWFESQAPSSAYTHRSGPIVPISTGKWVELRFDIHLLIDSPWVMQYGIRLKSECGAPEPAGVGGAGGAGSTDDSTIILIDNIRTQCAVGD